MNKTNKKMCYLSNFVTQAVVLSKQFVLLGYYSQTHCLELLIHLKNFLRQPVTILGEPVPHEKFSQTNGLNVSKISIYIKSVFNLKENDWQLMRFLLLSYFSPFMVTISFYGIFRNWEKNLKSTLNKFLAII